MAVALKETHKHKEIYTHVLMLYISQEYTDVQKKKKSLLCFWGKLSGQQTVIQILLKNKINVYAGNTQLRTFCEFKRLAVNIKSALWGLK